MPFPPDTAESYTTPSRPEGKARRERCPTQPRQQISYLIMSLRSQQRQNELDAIQRYEQHLSALYAQSKNPAPSRWLSSDHSRELSRDC